MAHLKETNSEYYAGQSTLTRIGYENTKLLGSSHQEGERTFANPPGNASYILIKSWDFDTKPISAYGFKSLNQIKQSSNYTLFFQPFFEFSDFGEVLAQGFIEVPEVASFVASNLTKNERYLGLRTDRNSGSQELSRFWDSCLKSLFSAVEATGGSSQNISAFKDEAKEKFGKERYVQGNLYIQLKKGAVDTNYGDYSSICMDDIVNNFIVGYVGVGKLIQSVKRTDVMFHAKRGLQEFSYDTLKSIKSQELTIPPSLSLALPQDYVNYVKCCWIDDAGAKHIIYPTRVTSNPLEMPIQDFDGSINQDEFGDNEYSNQSITEESWAENSSTNEFSPDDYRHPRKDFLLGRRYGLQPEEAQINGKFTINERLGTFSFSSDLVDKLIILEYISDGLSDVDNQCIPKMAEQAMYMHIAHGILSSRINVPEYIINRYKRERSSALRNAKIRLSNVKIEEISQVFRNKGKWIKH